ncbi:MAG: hypothetical protein ABI220_01685 [Candidatus Saccharimonadales bacterium]
MYDILRHGDVVGVSGLPPKDYWLIDPDKEKLETPVDDRGLIDVSGLIRVVKDSIDPAYKWPTHLSVHHLYWEDEWYSSAFIGDHGQKFRELPIHKALLPRVFENWLHRVTSAPDIPDPDVMHMRIESWQAAKLLFESVRKVVVWERRARRRESLIYRHPEILPYEFHGEDMIGKEILGGILTKNFGSLEPAIERHRRIPKEFQLLDTSGPPIQLAAALGKLVAPKALDLARAVAA